MSRGGLLNIMIRSYNRVPIYGTKLIKVNSITYMRNLHI